MSENLDDTIVAIGTILPIRFHTNLSMEEIEVVVWKTNETSPCLDCFEFDLEITEQTIISIRITNSFGCTQEAQQIINIVDQDSLAFYFEFRLIDHGPFSA